MKIGSKSKTKAKSIKSLKELAKAMELSIDEVRNVLQGKKPVNSVFIQKLRHVVPNYSSHKLHRLIRDYRKSGKIFDIESKQSITELANPVVKVPEPVILKDKISKRRRKAPVKDRKIAGELEDFIVEGKEVIEPKIKEGVINRYKEFLPITGKTPTISLGEGDTPLISCERLAVKVGCKQLYFKLEGCHPTGSFKDRGMVVAVAKAVEEGSKAVICASTGNTSASAAAYAACCGLECVVVIPGGKIALGKLAQAIVYGAKIVAIDGNFDKALKIVRELSERNPVTLVNSLNPNRIEGQKTAAFEIIDVLGEAPDYLFLPVGNAGNITAYWKGFKEYYAAGKATKKSKMYGFQAEGAAPIVRGHVIEKPETVATAIRIGNPASWQKAVAARDESGGIIDMVSDEEILAAQSIMASEAGIFGEPASGASLAGLIKLTQQGRKFSEQVIVCIVTGNGLKDTETALKKTPKILELPGDVKAVEKALGWGK